MRSHILQPTVHWDPMLVVMIRPTGVVMVLMMEAVMIMVIKGATTGNWEEFGHWSWYDDWGGSKHMNS